MESWQTVLVVVMAAGFGLVLAAALVDRTRRRARDRALTAPPDRPIPGLDPSSRPTYVSKKDALTPPAAADAGEGEGDDAAGPDPAPSDTVGAGRSALDARLAGVRGVAATLASPAMATDTHSRRAVLTGARVLVCAEPVETFREVLRVLGAHDPLVVVAPAFADEVRDTLAANRVQRLHRVAAVVADDDARAELAARTGAAPVSRQDLQSGWVPDAALGRAETWVAGRTQSWVW